MQIEDQVGVPAGDHPLAEVTFRLCRLMLARKVLWDDDAGFEIAQLAVALEAPSATVVTVLSALHGEGWVVVDADGGRPSLTASGVSAILGRSRSAEAIQQRDAHGAGSAGVAAADDRLR
jgi:hypothetical protein